MAVPGNALIILNILEKPAKPALPGRKPIYPVLLIFRIISVMKFIDI